MSTAKFEQLESFAQKGQYASEYGAALQKMSESEMTAYWDWVNQKRIANLDSAVASARAQAMKVVDQVKSVKFSDPKALQDLRSSLASLPPFQADIPFAQIQGVKYSVDLSANAISDSVLEDNELPTLLKLDYNSVTTKFAPAGSKTAVPDLRYAFEVGRLRYAQLSETSGRPSELTGFVVVVNALDGSLWLVYDFTLDQDPQSVPGAMTEVEDGLDDDDTDDVEPETQGTDPRDPAFIQPWGILEGIKGSVGVAKLFNVSDWKPQSPISVTLNPGKDLFDLATYDLSYTGVMQDEFSKAVSLAGSKGVPGIGGFVGGAVQGG